MNYFCSLLVASPKPLKDLFHPACLARVVSWLAFVVEQRPTKRPHVQGMLDEPDPLKSDHLKSTNNRAIVKDMNGWFIPSCSTRIYLQNIAHIFEKRFDRKLEQDLSVR